jgi:PAS domain S-box-containing protein
MKIRIRMTLLFGRQAQNIENEAKRAVSGIGLSTRLALAMVSLVVVTTTVLSFITYHFVTEAAIPRSLDRLATKAMLCATKLETALNVARQDVMIIQGVTGVVQMGVARAIHPFEPLSDMPLRESIAARFLPVLAAKPDYAQLRIIGVADGGRELLRVDRSGPGGTPRIVPEAELIQTGERDYFKRTIGLPKSDVYVSPVELKKDGETGGPAVPMLHVAIPLWTPNGEPFGISVIDFDLGPKFDRVRVEGGRGSQVFIANEAGDYLLHPDRSREFASEAGIPVRIQNDFPGFDGALAGGAANDSGIWTGRSGVRFGVGWAAVRLAGGAGLTVLVATTYSNLTVGRAAVNSSALTGGAVAVLLAILLAVAIARSLSKPLVQITRAAEGLSRGELMAMPSDGGREIAVLSATFAEMATQIRTKQALLENTIESIGDSVLVVDERGQIIVANAAAKQLLGIVPGSGTTKGTRKLSYFYPDGVTPMPVFNSAVARALRGESVDDVEFIAVPEGPCVQAHIVSNARPLRDESGILRGAVTVLRNITEQKRAHQSLVDSEQMAQAIINTAIDAFIQMDETGVILDWSPHAEAMLGWTRSEAVGANANDLLAPELHRDANNHWVVKFLHDVGSGAKGWRFEAPLLHRDGNEIFTEMSLTGLRRGEGHIINAFIRDITQKRAAEEQLIQAQKMESVGQLTGGIAHDFNNMLTVITGTIEILAEAVKNEPHLARIVTLISEAADRGSELTANLLAFARKQPLQPVEIDVNALVNEVSRLLSPTLGRQIEIKTVLSDDVWPALVDPGQLSSALVNLAINARDAMPDGGTLTFATINVPLDGYDAAGDVDPQESFVIIEVSDTGTGIPEAIRDKIFDPFFSTKEMGQGTGLGLSMVFGFAKQSGGNIEVHSEQGRGTSFRLYLPKAGADASQLPLEDNLQPMGGTETILCVEDDASVRANIITQLESLGYKVITASNAAEALAIADGGAEFDLLFTDIVMPGKMNGKQLAERMRLRWPSLRVLLTSGYTDHSIIRDGRLVPDVFFLPKPYRRPQLARMLRRCLDAPVVVASQSRSAMGDEAIR